MLLGSKLENIAIRPIDAFDPCPAEWRISDLRRQAGRRSIRGHTSGSSPQARDGGFAMRKPSSRFRPLLLVFAVLAALVARPALADQRVCDSDGCWYIPEPPPPPNCQGGQCIPSGHPTVSIHGVVTDVHGSPISGASVFWNYWTTTSSTTGAFTVTVWTDGPVALTAEKDRFAYQTIMNNTPSITWTPSFNLQYAISGKVTPGFFNNSPAKTLIFSAYSTAPATGTVMRAQLPLNAGMLSLAFDSSYTDPDGWSKWVGSWTVPSGSADQTYTYKVCALNAAGGTCDAPTGLTLAITTASYTIDSLAPTVAPLAFNGMPARVVNTTSRRPTIATTATDASSGISVASTSFQLDGTGRPFTFNSQTGLLALSPATDLSLGQHYAYLTVFDLAGNSTSVGWYINIASVTAEGATAALSPRTISVPVGTQQAQFPNAALDVSRYDYTVSSLSGTGLDTWTRSVPLGSIIVRFQNGAATTDVPITADSSNQTSGTSILRVIELARSGGQLTASKAAEQLNVGTITAAVPAGYACPTCNATLQMAYPIALGAPSTPPTLLGSPLPSQSLALTVSSQSEVDVADVSAGGGITLPRGKIDATTPIGNVDYTLPLPEVSTGDFKATPDVTCNHQASDHTSCIATGAALSYMKAWTSQVYISDIYPTAARFYGNHWLYKDANQTTYLAWHQQSATVNDGTCVSGSRLKTTLNRFSSSTKQILLDSLGKSAWTAGSQGETWNAHSMNPTDPNTLNYQTVALPWDVNSMANHDQAELSGESDLSPTTSTWDSTGPAWATLSWNGLVNPSDHSVRGATNANEQVVLGVRYIPRPPSTGADSSPPPALKLLSIDTWEATIAPASC